MNLWERKFELFQMDKRNDISYNAIDDISVILAGINQIVQDSGESLEGNIFYEGNEQIDKKRYGNTKLNKKQINFCYFALSGSSMLEIGFNAGHSCLLALMVNPTLNYIGVDLGFHSYTKPCFEYLQSFFGDRVSLIFGDSRNVLQNQAHLIPEFDLCHIDGGHEPEQAYGDIKDVLSIGSEDFLILIDDTWQEDIDSICDHFMMLGWLVALDLRRTWKTVHNQRMLRTNLHNFKLRRG